jgi:hypothetical protein
MMKYKGTYLKLFSIMLKKYLKEQYGSEVTKKALKESKAIYKEMLEKVDDIGADNPMASNIYSCFVFLAIWKAAEGAIDVESFMCCILNLESGPIRR